MDIESGVIDPASLELVPLLITSAQLLEKMPVLILLVQRWDLRQLHLSLV